MIRKEEENKDVVLRFNLEAKIGLIISQPFECVWALARTIIIMLADLDVGMNMFRHTLENMRQTAAAVLALRVTCLSGYPTSKNVGTMAIFQLWYQHLRKQPCDLYDEVANPYEGMFAEGSTIWETKKDDALNR